MGLGLLVLIQASLHFHEREGALYTLQGQAIGSAPFFGFSGLNGTWCPGVTGMTFACAAWIPTCLMGLGTPANFRYLQAQEEKESRA